MYPLEDFLPILKSLGIITRGFLEDTWNTKDINAMNDFFINNALLLEKHDWTVDVLTGEAWLGKRVRVWQGQTIYANTHLDRLDK